MAEEREGARFVPINRKVGLIILISLMVGLGAVIFYFTSALTGTIEESVEEGLEEQADILYTAVENFMLPGQAPLAVQYFREVEQQNPDYSVMLFRSNGVQAFSDNATIGEVNERLGGRTFTPKTEKETPAEPKRRDDPHFRKTVSKPPLMQVFRESEEGRTYYRIYKPLINKPKCARCHGSSHTIRGVIEVRSDITSSVRRQRSAVVTSASIFLGVLLVLSAALTRFMQRAVLRPVTVVRDVCTAVTRGDFSRKVDRLTNDEIGELGSTVNQMVEGLYERFELSKYVSSSTIRSLKGGGTGKNLGLTVFFSDIRYSFPPGTVIVKEIYRGFDPPAGERPMRLTAMVKRSEDERARGGWLWVMKDPEESSERVITGEFCVTCHSNANEGHPYGDGNPQEAFRDFVFFPPPREGGNSPGAAEEEP